jgi:hypothetical protein
MATVVTWNGTSYTIPGAGDENWAGANKVDGLLISLATNGFQKSGGTFTLSADADFGVSAGLKSLYFKTRSSNIATTGNFRLANADVGVVWRNAANSADLPLTVNASNQLTFNGNPIISSTGIIPPAAGGTGVANNAANTITFSGNFGLTLTLTNTTSVTLPTSGTLATLAGTESLTNKTLSETGTVAAAGPIRLVNNSTGISWRNAANSADVSLTVNASNQLVFAGVVIHDSSGINPPAAGGTGKANNAANTITFSGNFGLTLTLTNTTSVTLPTSGTLATLAGTESLTNKTLSETGTVASAGPIRLINNSTGINWRNAANSADLPLTVNASNVLSYNGVGFLSTTGGLTVGGNTTGDSNLGTIASVTLSQYYQGSFSMTFTGPFTADQTVTVSYVKIGRMVMLSIPSIVAAASVAGVGSIASTANLPTGLDPAASTMYEIPIRDNSAVQTNPGKIQIRNANTIRIFRTNTGTAWSATGNAGWDDAIAVTYYSAS